MASVTVSAAWSDPSASLTADQTYIVQNKSTQVVQFFEGATFNAGTNDGDGVLLVPMYNGGAGANAMRWTYTSANQVRLRLTAAGFGGGDAVEFALAG